MRQQYDSSESNVSRLDFSEEDMANAFERRLRSRRPLLGMGRFSQIFREVDCRRGRPDFIGIASPSVPQPISRPSQHNLATSSLLSLLKARSPRTRTWLERQTGLSRDVVARALRNLVQNELAEAVSPGRYLLAGGATMFETECTAFELKLKNPRRAVFQAQYTLFAQRVWIIVPPSQASSFDVYQPVLQRWGIGVAWFDLHSRRCQAIYPARRRPAGSREHQAYALLRLSGSLGA